MSHLEEYPLSTIEEIKDIFYENIKNQTILKAYPEQFQIIRKPLVQWIINICDKCFFKPETLYRTSCLYDLLISETKTENDEVNVNDLKLSIVACLSISTKLNEHNANYVQFFTDNILNVSALSLSSSTITHVLNYSITDLSLREIEIPKLIDYNVNTPTVYHFNSLFLQICLMQFKSDQTKQSFITLNKKILKEYITTSYCIRMSSLNSAIIVLNETLQKFISESNIMTQTKIIKTIKTLIEDNKELKKQLLFETIDLNDSNRSSYETKTDLFFEQ